MEIGISHVYGYGPFLAPDGCSNRRLCFHFEVRHHQVTIQCRQIDDRTQIPSSSAPETAGCRTREMFRSEPSLWLPWTAGHPRPAGDPGGCSWCGTRCCDGWVEVDVGSLDTSLPWLCWWPDRIPAVHTTEGQSQPGEPPPVSHQRRPTAGAWVIPEDLRRWDTHWDVDSLPGQTLHERTVCPVWWSSEWWVDL